MSKDTTITLTLPKLRKVYNIVELPWQCQFYKDAYDHSSLSNVAIWKNDRKLLRLLAKSLFKFTPNHVTGKFSIDKSDNRICSFRAKNTQYHSIYFDRFQTGYEPEVCYLLDYLLNDTDCFYDIGANWGFFTGFVASRKNFKGVIHAFEPQALVYKDLLSFVGQSGFLSNIKCHHIGLSSSTGSGKINLPDGLHSGLGQVDKNKGENIQLRRLDDFKIEPPKVIKLDAEYHEYEILLGSTKLILSHQPYIIFESDFGKDADRVIKTMELLKNLGYEFYYLSVCCEGLGSNFKESQMVNSKRESDIPTTMTLEKISITERMTYHCKLNLLACHKMRPIK